MKQTEEKDKKQYVSPEMKVRQLIKTNIICTSDDPFLYNGEID